MLLIGIGAVLIGIITAMGVFLSPQPGQESTRERILWTVVAIVFPPLALLAKGSFLRSVVGFFLTVLFSPAGITWAVRRVWARPSWKN